MIMNLTSPQIIIYVIVILKITKFYSDGQKLERSWKQLFGHFIRISNIELVLFDHNCIIPRKIMLSSTDVLVIVVWNPGLNNNAFVEFNNSTANLTKPLFASTKVLESSTKYFVALSTEHAVSKLKEDSMSFLSWGTHRLKKTAWAFLAGAHTATRTANELCWEIYDRHCSFSLWFAVVIRSELFTRCVC